VRTTTFIEKAHLDENLIMPECSISKKEIKYVPPTPEVLEQVARGVCQKLGELDPSFSVEETMYEFSAFLSAVAKMHANRLNKLKSSVDSSSLDSEKRLG
jgi:hypothetical protein